jgi:solute carrier family 25 aspartate/glutamate transporter 12/13
MDIIERVLREATARSKDGRIGQTEFLNHCALSSRYSLFTPMEASIIFHFAGRGAMGQRLALIDFAQLLDPRWRAPGDLEGAAEKSASTTASSVLSNLAHSAYNFMQGGEHIQISMAVTQLTPGRFRWCTRSDHCVPDRSRYVPTRSRIYPACC